MGLLDELESELELLCSTLGWAAFDAAWLGVDCVLFSATVSRFLPLDLSADCFLFPDILKLGGSFSVGDSVAPDLRL